MKHDMVELLHDPLTGHALKLVDARCDDGGEVVEGELGSESGTSYRVVDGIPRFSVTSDDAQQQTEDSFGFKWHQVDSFSSPEVIENYRAWLVEKYGFGTDEKMRSFFAGRRRVLDVGCGAGLSSSVYLDENWPDDSGMKWYGVDISNAIDVAKDRLGDFPCANFVQADALHMPFAEGSFDTVFSEGVLHHTPSTEDAVKSAAKMLEPEGEFLFYVYRKKGPIREFTDDYIRDIVSDMEGSEAWEMLRPLTKLGQALAELEVEIDVPEDIPFLGIKAGKQDIQRLIYWNIAKVYWNEKMSFEWNHHVNFDWYHPKYAHRQTEQEIRRWCEEASLSINYFHEQESGYTVRAIKKAA